MKSPNKTRHHTATAKGKRSSSDGKTAMLAELAAGFSVPSTKDLQRMNLFALNKLANAVEKATFSMRIPVCCPADLRACPPLFSLFSLRNSRVLRAALTSSQWKKLIKSCMTARAVRHADIQSQASTFTLEIPANLTEKALRKVFARYEQSLSGFFSLVTLSKTGAVKHLSLSDTVDLERFLAAVLQASTKNRTGGAPLYSAKIFAEGTVIRGTDKRWYRANKHKDSKRWVPCDATT